MEEFLTAAQSFHISNMFWFDFSRAFQQYRIREQRCKTHVCAETTLGCSIAKFMKMRCARAHNSFTSAVGYDTIFQDLSDSIWYMGSGGKLMSPQTPQMSCSVSKFIKFCPGAHLTSLVHSGTIFQHLSDGICCVNIDSHSRSLQICFVLQFPELGQVACILSRKQ